MAFEVRGPLVPEVETKEELIALKHENSDVSWQWKRLFCGQRQQHSYYLYHELNNHFLNNKIQKVVEIGTGAGCLTIVFGLYASLINAEVLTLDIDPDLSRRLHPLFRKLDIQTYWQDENSKITKEYIKRFIDENMCYVFCDGGNKVEELNYWSKHIPVGSLISVHDWLNEVQPSDVPEGLTPYRKDYWNIMNIQTATWIKNGEPNVD